jgi:hypothetical protein
MIYACKKCQGPLFPDAPGYLTCKACKRDVELPDRVQAELEAKQNKTITWGQLGSHGLDRKDIAGADAYQKPQPEFPLEDVPF